MAQLRVLPPAKKYFEKIKEYLEHENGDPEIVIVILADTRVNFYEELKRYLK